MNYLIIFLCFVDILLGVVVFRVKHTFLEKQTKRDELTLVVRETKEAISILEAEWSYVTSPRYLKNIVATKNDLAPVSAQQIISFKNLPSIRKEESQRIPDDIYKSIKTQPIIIGEPVQQNAKGGKK